MNEQRKQLFQRGLRLQGLNRQFDQTIEECAELIVAIQHFKRDRNQVRDIVTEIEDVRQLCDMLEIAIDRPDLFLAEKIEKEEKYRQYLDDFERTPR